MNITLKDLINSDLIDTNKQLSEDDIRKAYAIGLKRLRIYNKISQIQVADYLHIRQSQISEYENVINVPSVVTAIKLAYYYQMSIENILVIGLLDTAVAQNYMTDYYFGKAENSTNKKPSCTSGLNEMLEVVCEDADKCDICTRRKNCDLNNAANWLYAAGYRKADEVRTATQTDTAGNILNILFSYIDYKTSMVNIAGFVDTVRKIYLLKGG